jgi:hypothetical protein
MTDSGPNIWFANRIAILVHGNQSVARQAGEVSVSLAEDPRQLLRFGPRSSAVLRPPELNRLAAQHEVGRSPAGSRDTLASQRQKTDFGRAVTNQRDVSPGFPAIATAEEGLSKPAGLKRGNPVVGGV